MDIASKTRRKRLICIYVILVMISPATIASDVIDDGGEGEIREGETYTPEENELHEHGSPLLDLRFYRTDELRDLVDAGRITKDAYVAELESRKSETMSEYAEAPARALFASMGIGTLYPALDHPAKARLTLKELAPVDNLRVELVNQTGLLNVDMTPLQQVLPDFDGFISLPITLVPLNTGVHTATWAITGAVDGHHFRRLTTIEIVITDSQAENTMRQTMTPVLELNLLQPQPVSQSVSPTASANRDNPVVMLHGLDPIGTDSGQDVNSGWNNMMTSLQNYGWSSTYGVGFYECDENYNINVENYGKPGVSDIHSLELGGRTQAENHHNELYCGWMRGPIGTHDSDTTIHHLSYHWAWAMSSIFGTGCIEVIGHSMGGLIPRYAAQRIGANDPDFPNDLCIEDAVTLGAPHGGSDGGFPYGAEYCTEWAYQCRQMLTTSNFVDWLGTYARNPQAYGGTDWTAMGSRQDSSVSAYLATTDNFDPDHAYIYPDHEHSSAQASGTQKHWRNSDSNSVTAEVDVTEADIGPERSYSHFPYVNLATDKSLAYDNWGCGMDWADDPWYIVDELVVTGERYSSSLDCLYAIVVPSGQDSLVVTATSPSGDDIDLKLRYGSNSATPTCSQTTSASTETCTVSNPSSGTWYILVEMPGPANTLNPFLVEADYSDTPDDLTGITYNVVPTSVGAGDTFQVCWTVQGTGSISHTNVHFGQTTSANTWTTTASNGQAPSYQCHYPVAPSSGPIYLKAHAVGPNDNFYGAVKTIQVVQPADLTGVSITQIPSSVSPGQSFQVCWSVSGTGEVSHTNIHSGTTTAADQSYSTAYAGTAPMSKCDQITAPSSGTLYVKAHATGPNDDMYSSLHSVTVSGSSQTDCGVSGDAGDTTGTARTISLPKTCQGTLTSTNTTDVYRFYAYSGDVISAKVTPQSGADFDMCLLNPSGTSTGCSVNGGSSYEQVAYKATTTGYWFVEIYQYSGTGTYDLEASTGTSFTIQDDDNTWETSRTVDYNDDVVIKEMVVPYGSVDGMSTATLWIWGQATKCNGGGARWGLDVNYVRVENFDACAKWPSSSFGWASFSVPLSELADGTTNYFEIDHLSGDWTLNSVKVAVDTDTDYGRTQLQTNGSDQPGEMLWRLTLS